MLSELGGAQYSLLETCIGLSACGVNVVAAVPHGPLFDSLSEKGICVYPVSPVRATSRGWGFFTTAAKLLRTPSTIRQIVRVVKPNVIHANSLPAFLAAHKAVPHVPVIWHVRDLQLPPVVAREAAKKAARIIAASNTIDEMLMELISSLNYGSIRLIRNGIDFSRFANCDRSAVRQRLGLPDGCPVIGMIAHLIPWKRHDAFIKAAIDIHRQRPDAHFVLVGRDLFNEHAGWGATLKKMIADAGLELHFHWIADCTDASQVLPALDVLMHPARFEPFGRVICEGMAASVPVIAASSGGPATIIEANVSGILVRDGDPQRMAEEALALLADPARVAALTTAGRDRVFKEFNVTRVCERLAKEYRAVIADAEFKDSRDDD